MEASSEWKSIVDGLYFDSTELQPDEPFTVKESTFKVPSPGEIFFIITYSFHINAIYHISLKRVPAGAQSL